jgi:hypothetical protein
MTATDPIDLVTNAAHALGDLLTAETFLPEAERATLEDAHTELLRTLGWLSALRDDPLTAALADAGTY